MKTIDVHSHFIPQTYIDALRDRGIGEKQIGFPMEPWDAGKRIELMDKADNQAALISLSSPGLRYFHGDDLVNLCRKLNDELAELVREHPTRFGSFIALPLPDVDASLAEIDRCYTDLDADGVCAMTNYDQVFIGDPAFHPIHEELNRRGAVFFFHPTENAGDEVLTQGYPAPAFEYPFESTRAVVSLLKHRVIERCPDIKYIISHGGGTLPFIGPRLTKLLPLMSGGSPEEKEAQAKTYDNQVASLYFDMALVQYHPSLMAIADCQATDKLMMGFDQPFNAFTDMKTATDQILGFQGFAGAEEAIASGNALRIMPGLAKRLAASSAAGSPASVARG